MNQPFQATPVTGIGPTQTVDQGDTVAFAMTVDYGGGEKDEVYFSLPFDLLPPLINNLLLLFTAADDLRSQNPIHEGTSSGYTLTLEHLSLAQNQKKEGWHILQFDVKNSQGGSTKYLLTADKTRLENLADAIYDYLDDMDASTPAANAPH